MLVFLVKKLNDNFGVKDSEKTMGRILNAQDIEWTKPILKPKFDDWIKKSRIELKNITLILLIIQNICLLKNPYNEGWVFSGGKFHEEQSKYGNQRISVNSEFK